MVGGFGRPGASRGVLSFSLRSPLTEPPCAIDVAYWPFATFRCLVAVGGTADIGTRWRPEDSVACDPGCVKTLRGITAPGILGYTVTLRAKKRKNLSCARHYDQIRFRFHTAKTQSSGVSGSAST